MPFTYKGDQEFLVYCIDEFIDRFKGRDNLLQPNSDDLKLYNVNYPNTAVFSEKQNLTYRLSRYLNNLYIDVDIHSPQFIRRMPNSFWSMFIELDTLGELKFTTSYVNENIQNKLNEKSSKSAIFELIKEIVLRDEYEPYGEHIDLGGLTVIFDLSNNQPDLVDKIIKSINLLYKINYQLYRKSYLSYKK